MENHLGKTFQRWRPGKIQISRLELVHDELISTFNNAILADCLGVLEFQIEKMMRNSPKK